MDDAHVDRLIARAQNPRLIPGIYNYCDGRCPRCPFTDRCLTYRDNQASTSGDEGASLPERVGATLRKTVALLAEIRGTDIDLAARRDDDDELRKIEGAFRRHYDNPIVARSREYALLAWPIAKALEPVVKARGEPQVAEAVDTIGWFSTLISSKVFRAIAGEAELGLADADHGQPDHDGSAKIALIGIGESRAAWRVLMEHGKATADGVPAQAVQMLDALAADIRERFPNAMAFVRPGFDEPAGAA